MQVPHDCIQGGRRSLSTDFNDLALIINFVSLTLCFGDFIVNFVVEIALVGSIPNQAFVKSIITAIGGI
jgi:hypothetical protein